MSTIQTYHDVHPDHQTISFDIKRMEEIHDAHGGIADAPHRHDYFTILLVKQASGTHLIDFQAFELQANQVYFISPGQVHQLIELEKPFGCVLTFSRQFMLENGIDACFIEDLHLFQDAGYTPPLALPADEIDPLTTLAESMLAYAHSDKKFKYQAVGSLLKLFLIQCNNSCTLPEEENTQVAQASVSLLRDFKNLLETRFQHWHKVAEYANAMHITADHLNASVKSLTGKSAKEHIQSRLIVSAKRQLLFSGLTTKEVAYELGFSEPANFSQFFKKRVGNSPSEFRKLQR